MNFIEIGLLVAALVLILFYLYSRKVYLFYSDKCIHCINMKKEWEAFEKLCKWTFIIPIRIDYDDPKNKEICDRFNIKSIPTIMKIENRGPVFYKGNRTAALIFSWAKS